MAAQGVRADAVIDIAWEDLVPSGGQSANRLRSLVDHNRAAQTAQSSNGGVRTDLNGQVVRIAGFIVPMEFKGNAVTGFILVPFVGACIHTPPPPANQLIYVTTAQPYTLTNMFAAVQVTGMFGTAAMSTQLAEIGYALSADDIRPYRG